MAAKKTDEQVYKTDALIAEDIDAYLEQHQHKSLLRFITCGSVDDGKSTLIGRLLYDSKMIFEDQLAALEADSKRVGTQGQEIDFALLVDGLAAEREQGVAELVAVPRLAGNVKFHDDGVRCVHEKAIFPAPDGASGRRRPVRCWILPKGAQPCDVSSMKTTGPDRAESAWARCVFLRRRFRVSADHTARQRLFGAVD